MEKPLYHYRILSVTCNDGDRYDELLFISQTCMKNAG